MFACKLETGTFRFSTERKNDGYQEIEIDRPPSENEACDIIDGEYIIYKLNENNKIEQIPENVISENLINKFIDTLIE